MAKRDKRIAAMRQNPKTVRPDELDTVLLHAGFTVQSQAGSHKVYVLGPRLLSIPQHRPFLKQAYVEAALAALDEEDA